MAENNLDNQRAQANPNAGKQSANQSNGTDTVTVGCKLPHGLILDLTEPGEPARRFTVKGTNSARIIGGFGITPGVPRDFWNQWLERNAQLGFVKQKLIFAMGKQSDAEAKAEELAALASGFERMMDPLRPKPRDIQPAG